MSVSSELSSASAPAEHPNTPPLLRELLVLVTYELRALIFGLRSILFLVIYGGFGAAVGGGFSWMVRELEKQAVAKNPALAALDRQAMMAQMLRSDELREQLGPAIERFGGEALLEALARGDLPWVVLVVLLSSTFLLPGLILLVGYDRISEDLSTKFCRFVLQRVRRGTYLTGKLLGHWLVSLLAVIAVHLGLVALGATLVPDFDAGRVMAAMPSIWLGMACFTLAYSAYTMLLSTLFVPPFAALALGAIGLVVMWFLSLGPLNGVWMGTWDMGLWVLQPTALLVFLAHALLLFGAAHLVLSRRDV